MLYLNPPFWVINGITLFPDHADPAQFYFMPLTPHLVTQRDATSNIDVPQIQLIKYHGANATGGFLNCDVNLAVPNDVLTDVGNQLKRLANLSVTPRLAAVPVVDGTVKILLLGAESATSPPATPPPAGTAAPAPATGPRFVIKIQSAGKPSLYGDEDATFSIQLDQDGTTIIEQALQGTMSPVGVVYSLDYFALRPAYSVRVSVDWNRVQTHLEEGFHVNLLFVEADVDKAIDQLIENRTIVVEADTFVPDGDDTKDIDARRDLALAEVREMIKSTFFESSIPPPGLSKPTDAQQAVSVMNAMAHPGAEACFSYKKVDLTRIDHKSLNASFEERTTVRKTIYPQGHLDGLFSTVKGGLPLSRFVVPVDLDNPYFARREVQVISRADFERDGILSIDVTLTYGGQPQTAMLEPGTGNDRKKTSWGSVLDGKGAMVRPVTYSYRVTFKDADRTQRPVTLDTKDLALTLSTVEDQLEISPRDLLYGIADVPVVAVAFPWDRYPQVDVECRYTDDPNQIHQLQLFRLTQDAPNANFQMFLRDTTKRQFDYHITYHGADGKDIALPWTTPDDEQVEVRDPFPTKRQLVVVAQMDWTTIDRVFVDLAYQNGPTADDEIDQSYEFNAQDYTSKTFVFNPKDPTQKLVSYQVTILTKAGATITVPKSFTAERRLIVRANMRGHRVIAVTPAQVPFASVHAVGIEMDVRYVDDANGLSFTDHFSFKSPADHFSFEFDYVDTTKNQYEYKYSTAYDNGLSRDSDWATAAADTLTVPVA